jgi:hypothetical protein
VTDRLEPSEPAIARFVDALFRYADPETFVSLRAFDQFRRDVPPVLIEGVQVGEDVAGVVYRAVRAAGNTANRPEPVVFAPPVATFRGDRKASMAEMANGVALSVEMDAGDPQRALAQLAFLIGPPTVVVASGGEWTNPDTGEVFQKQHFHWRLTEPTRTEAEHRRLQAAREMAAALVGADPTAAPPCHPLRWPGSWNRKRNPKLADIIGGDDTAEIDLQEACDRLEEAVEAAGLRGMDEGSRASGEPQAAIDLIISALAAIPNEDLHWDDWTKMGLAMWRATGGSAEGLNAWADWSAKSKKHEDQACVDRWKHFAAHPPSRIGAGSIFFRAKALGWQRPIRAGQSTKAGPDDYEVPPYTEEDIRDPGEPQPEPGFRPPPPGEETASRQRRARGEPAQIAWQSPIDFLADDEETGVPELRPHHLPEALWGFVQDTAERMGVDPASVALTAIVTCASIISDDWEIQPKRFDDEWTENPRLWGGIVGDPSVLKSPVLKACTKPIDKIEMRARKAHEEALERYKVQHKEWKDAKGSPADEPRKPRAVRYLVGDTTVEKLGELLRTDGEAQYRAPARKVLVRSDELAELLGSFDRYKSGGSGSSDRGAYLRLYNGGPHPIDRIGRGSFTVPNWSACIIGGIQPDVFKAIATNTKEDGLMQRFMFCVPGPTGEGQDRTPNASAVKRYEALLEALAALEPPRSALGSTLPSVVLHEAAHVHRESIRDLVRALSGMPDVPGRLKAAYGKWSGLFARLALTFHLIEAADTTVRTGQRPRTQILGEETAGRVAAYMEEILLPHLLRADAVIYTTQQAAHAQWIAKFIMAQGKERITVRDIMRSYKALKAPEQRRELAAAMENLVSMAWLLPEQPDTPAASQTAWIVNPLVLKRFADRGRAERERRAKVREKMGELIRNRVRRGV